MWWTVWVKILGTPDWIQEHRILYKGGDFFGFENVQSCFSSLSTLNAFKVKLLSTESGIIDNIPFRDSSIVSIEWKRD